METVFDVPVIARRCLGRHWPTQSRAERAEFTDVLAGVLVVNDFVVGGVSFVAQHRAHIERALASPVEARLSS